LTYVVLILINSNYKNLILMEKTNIEKSNLKIVNFDEFEGSTYKTKKKSFVSGINPHLERRNI